jgi:hypothetical protein
LVISNDNNIGGSSSNLDFFGGVLGIQGNTITNIDSHGSTDYFKGGGFDIQSPTNTFTLNRDLEFSEGPGLIKNGAGTLVVNASGYNLLPGESGSPTGGGTISVLAGTLVLEGNNNQGLIFSGDTTVGTVTIHNGADIHGKLIFDYTNDGGSTNPAPQVLNALTTGYHESTKFSSASDPLFTSANSNTHEGLGWKDDGTAVTVMKTFYGDANLDGTVNALDFNAFATNYGQDPGSEVWDQGDFNYDGSVDSSDFAIFAANYGMTLPTSAAIPDDGLVAQSLGSVVPEPASLALLALGGAAMSIRRRRR